MSTITLKRSSEEEEHTTHFSGTLTHGFTQLIMEQGSHSELEIIRVTHPTGSAYSTTGIRRGIKTAQRAARQRAASGITNHAIPVAFTIRYTLDKQTVTQGCCIQTPSSRH